MVDDRGSLRLGAKLTDAELIGFPYAVVECHLQYSRQPVWTPIHAIHAHRMLPSRHRIACRRTASRRAVSACVRACVCACAPVCMRACVDAWFRAHICASMLSCVRVCVYSCGPPAGQCAKDGRGQQAPITHSRFRGNMSGHRPGYLSPDGCWSHLPGDLLACIPRTRFDCTQWPAEC